MREERFIKHSLGTIPGRAVAAPLRARLQTLTDWRHVEVKDVPGTTPGVSMLLGPAVGESSAQVSEGFGGGGFGERSGSSDSRLNSGIACLAGRWVIPTTRRIRGITRGGIQLPDLGGDDGGGDGTSGEASGLMAPPVNAGGGGGGGEAGTLIVSSDARCDIVLFLGNPTGSGAAASTLQLALRGWKPGFTGPDDAEASEVPAALTLQAGFYCVVTTDIDKRMQRAVEYPWVLSAGAQQRHPPDVIEVVVRLNAQIKARGLGGSMKLLPVPTMG